MDKDNQMLQVFQPGEYNIIKKTEYGIWIDYNGKPMFINYSETFTNPDRWSKDA